MEYSFRITTSSSSCNNRQSLTFLSLIFVFLCSVLTSATPSPDPYPYAYAYPGEPDGEGAIPASVDTIEILMPNVRPTKNDDYICTSKSVNELGTQYIHKFEPNSSADKAHHMLLFACDDVEPELLKKGHWDCAHHYSACRSMRIIYAWAKNAPPTTLPKGVGFRIGPESNVKYLVLQVHYAHGMPEGTMDDSGFKVHISNQEPKYLAGIFMLLSGDLVIPANTEKTHGDSNCMLNANAPIHPFASRVHTHQWGSVVSGYYAHFQETEFHPLAKGNPQWPQAFYPIKDKITIKPRDLVAARCTFNTTGYNKDTRIGMTAGDEMCNLYIMFYTESRDPEDHFIQCFDLQFPQLVNALPADSDVPLPRNKTLEEHAVGHAYFSQHPAAETSDSDKKSHTKKRPGAEIQFDSDSQWRDPMAMQEEEEDPSRADRKLKPPTKSMYTAISGWPDSSIKFGQATGISFDTLGNVVIFHRADRTWGYNTFDNNNRFRQKSLGPISTDTIYVIHSVTGKLIHSWGKNRFYMPHGITIAPNGDTFLTDVALHQVFKYEPGQSTPTITLGVAFEPGSDSSHFCKPSAVAVLRNGDFFVSDGYCNSRIVKYDKSGNRLMEWGRGFSPSFLESFLPRGPPPKYTFSVPHALTIDEEADLICVADRENGRIQCFTASSGVFRFLIDLPEFGGQVFSVAYSPMGGGTLYAINGERPKGRPFSEGFVIPLSTKRISSVFSPMGKGFGQPHDLCVNQNGTEIFVVEITKPFKVWKFLRNDVIDTASVSHRTGKGTQESNPVPLPITSPVSPAPNLHQSDNSKSQPFESAIDAEIDDSFSSSVAIMCFLTIPLLLLIGVGALLRLRSTGACCNKRKEAKSFSEFFPPSAGFEKLRMDESEEESENSEEEVEEFTIPKYRKSLKT